MSTNPWPGVVKAYLGGDDQARHALADLFEEAGDQAQADALRTAGVKLYLARWQEDYTLGDQLAEQLPAWHHERKPARSLLHVTAKRTIVDEEAFYTHVERKAFEQGVPFKRRYDDAMWSPSEDEVARDIAADYLREFWSEETA